MKVVEKKYFGDIIINAILVCLVCGVFCTGFMFNKLSTVFVNDDYAAKYKGDETCSNISLMFNVYWGTEYIEDILATLKKYDAKATFFVGGCWVAKNDESFLKIVSAGHEIGNHGYFHKDHAKLDYETNYNEISVTHKLVAELSAIEMNLFAPPSGSFSDVALKVANDLNYKTIMWSKDTIDWRDKDSNTVFVRATKKISNGDLVLMHPTKHTLDALDKILAFYKNKMYNVVTVSQNLEGYKTK